MTASLWVFDHGARAIVHLMGVSPRDLLMACLTGMVFRDRKMMGEWQSQALC